MRCRQLMLLRRFSIPSLKKTKASSAKEGASPEARVLKGIFSFPFILGIFVLVAAASLILLRGSVRGLASPAFFESSGSFFLLFAAPLALIALGLALFYALASNLLKTGRVHPSAMRNFRLTCVFAILASAIFCVFANTFIRELFPFYHDDSVEQAMDGTAEIARGYAASRFLQAETVSSVFLTGLKIHNVERTPQSWLSEICSYDPSALAIQIYRINEEDGSLLPVKEEGDSSAFMPLELIAQMEDGSAKHDDGGGRALIRVKRTVRYTGNAYTGLYTSLFPPEIDEALATAQVAKARFAHVLKAEPLFPYFGFWLYICFILPPLLILLLCALYAFVRLSDPLVALENVCDGLMQGKAGVSLIPQKYTGLDNTVRFVNARSDAIDSAFELEAAAKASAQEKSEESKKSADASDNAIIKEESLGVAEDATESEGAGA